jgi:NADPH:quinone reductase-like Zn-dependent oxidoreductase
MEKPSPKEGEVLVKVHATSVNDWDWGMMDGRSLFNRLFSGLRKPKYPILGSDIAGTVEAVGKNVHRFQPGDCVFGDLSGRWGGFAQYVCAEEKALAIIPSGMSFEQAAAIPQAGMLAVQGLLDKGQLQAGQRLLINGAGGGVGTFGVQIAKLHGVETTGVDRTDKLSLLQSIGFDHVIDYTKEDFTQNTQRYDLILDVKTNRPILRYLHSLNPNGIYVTVGGSMSRLLQLFLLKPFVSLFTRKRVELVMLKPNKDLPYMKELFVTGKIQPVIDGYYRLEDVANAFRLFGKGGHKGKLVISIIS